MPRSTQSFHLTHKSWVSGCQCLCRGKLCHCEPCTASANTRWKVIVPTYDWAQFFYQPSKQTALSGIKAYIYLLGMSLWKRQSIVQYGKSNFWKMATGSPRSCDLPPIVKLPGLSQERRQCLFDKIREFCPDDCQDLVCPDPAQQQKNTPPIPKRPRRN